MEERSGNAHPARPPAATGGTGAVQAASLR